MKAITPQVLLIGGRSGVGKTAVGYEVSDQLRHSEIPHVLIDGDNLDHVHPKPEDSAALTETNLASLWSNYTDLGQHRLIYVNTVSVLEREMIGRAVGGAATLTAVLLTVEHATAHSRLRQRELGSSLDDHLGRSHDPSRRLDARADFSVHRVPTDESTVPDIAALSTFGTPAKRTGRRGPGPPRNSFATASRSGTSSVDAPGQTAL